MTQKAKRLGAGILLGDVCAHPNFGGVQSFYSLPCVCMILKTKKPNKQINQKPKKNPNQNSLQYQCSCKNSHILVLLELVNINDY